MPRTAATDDVDALLSPSYAARVAQQFFTHSAHAPVTILILEWLLEGAGYFSEPDGYVLILTALLQAAWLAHPRSASMNGVAVGNLLGVALYTIIEVALEGADFFDKPQHLAYWGIAATFAVLQSLQWRLAGQFASQALRLGENIVRAAIPVLLYALYEAADEKTVFDPWHFLGDSAHVYLTIVVLLLGILLAFADLTLQRTQQALRSVAVRLHQLSSWGFGAQVVAAALQDASQVALKRQERALLFMDIRGFTAWSEKQTPEAVVGMLNAYYAASENVLLPLGPIKFKYSADEVMAVFADKAEALAAALALQQAAAQTLAGYGLAAGIGLHAGPVVEGLLGSASTKAYEVIGDAVNTASRLCSAAGPGELLASRSAVTVATAKTFEGKPTRQIEARGKRELLTAYVLSNLHAHPAG